VLPAAAEWLSGALSVNDAGPFTENEGYVGFRVMVALTEATKWFVWATPPVNDTELNPQRRLRFVKCMSLGVLAQGDVTANIGRITGRCAGRGRAGGRWSVAGEHLCLVSAASIRERAAQSRRGAERADSGGVVSAKYFNHGFTRTGTDFERARTE